MRVDRLHLRQFRSYVELDLPLAPGMTALVGSNGEGKTNVLEALAYLATFRSFRAPTLDVLIRDGEPTAHIRVEGVRRNDREVLLEAELNRVGRNRVQLNRQRLARPGEALGVLRVTLFAPDDLALVKGGPQLRRELIDDLAAALDPRHAATLRQFERALRQRNALLRQLGGRLDDTAALTLEVWDAKLAAAGEVLMTGRAALIELLRTEVDVAHRALVGTGTTVDLVYRPAVEPDDLAARLATARGEDVRRGTTTVGPHRDEVELLLQGSPVRTHGSQGEQRSLALALRLGGHRLVTEVAGEAPLLLLDDVFSELDPRRCDALVANLPPGQTVLTSADRLPRTAVADVLYRVGDGTVR